MQNDMHASYLPTRRGMNNSAIVAGSVQSPAIYYPDNVARQVDRGCERSDHIPASSSARYAVNNGNKEGISRPCSYLRSTRGLLAARSPELVGFILARQGFGHRRRRNVKIKHDE